MPSCTMIQFYKRLELYYVHHTLALFSAVKNIACQMHRALTRTAFVFCLLVNIYFAVKIQFLNGPKHSLNFSKCIYYILYG